MPPATAEQRQPRDYFWHALFCNSLVFLTSVCIMVLELTASRLIAKAVGSSLYTWTSVIGVVLAGISMGNFLGGWLADRFPHRKALAWMFLLSSVCCLAVYPLNQLIGTTPRPEVFSWPMWVVAVVFFLFFLPSLMLGTISPIVASLALSFHERGTGATVGSVYAWGSIGSIAGTFLAGFFLISHFGTQHIIWMISALLAVMGVCVSQGQRFFRGAVLCGWLQFVCWVGFFASVALPYDAAADDSWNNLTWLGEKVGIDVNSLVEHAHEVGQELNLRGDEPQEYNTESDYFSINVGELNEDGDRVKALVLDHLTHSYFNPLNPTKLYYEYEKVYAAVTERAAELWDRTTTVPLTKLPATKQTLPSWATFDAGKKTLSIRGALSASRRDELLDLSSSAPYWKAVAELTSESNMAIMSGMSNAPLHEMPEGLLIPKSLQSKVRFDSTIQALVRYEVLNPDEINQLLSVGPDAEFRAHVDDLYNRSREISTVFLGGGGFVFPRWVEANFPYRPVIDVLELDPDVKLAVQREMGLPPDDETLVRTRIGDARNSVDDLLRENARRQRRNELPVLYDFAYGDAFNDFSVPWHLTTVEFCQKIRELLKPDGVYLVNIIDIYPRPTFPEQRPAGFGEVEFEQQLPVSFWNPANPVGEWIPVRDQKTFGPLEIRSLGTRKFGWRFKAPMTVAQESLLREILLEGGGEDSDAVQALDRLYDQTNFRPVYQGRIPTALVPTNLQRDRWVTAPAPYEQLEIRLRAPLTGQPAAAEGEYTCVLGYRGIMQDEARKKLHELGTGNKPFQAAIDQIYEQSRTGRTGQFLGAYIRTLTQVFPQVYVFSTQNGQPSSERDTFMAACSMRTLDLTDLAKAGGYWQWSPFATIETDARGQRHMTGQFPAILELSRGVVLTDDFAPVDNMLAPVFADR